MPCALSWPSKFNALTCCALRFVEQAPPELPRQNLHRSMGQQSGSGLCACKALACRAARLYPRSLTGLHNHTLAVVAPMPLSSCRIIAAYNRCASGVRAALPEHVLLFTLTTVCYTCSPLRDSGQHHYCCSAFRLRSIRLAFTFPASRNDKAPTFPPGLFLFFMPPLKVKAAYQSRLKYDAFNLLLQYSAAKMSIFVPNVFLLRKAMHHDQAD